ncbi:hypothetical protein ACOMHN_051358 [Nucella lapillus]
MACIGDVWAYRPPLSLWRLVEQNVSPEEQEEIRGMLGTSLIETSLDLHNEAETLLEIWQDYQDETEAEVPRTPTLAEPPYVRERLVKEICFLAEGVQEKSLKKGMDPSAIFSGHNSHILEYAEEAKWSGSSLGRVQPMSARSVDGTRTPLSPSDVASSRMELSDTMCHDVSSSSDKLNYMNFDQVCHRLRKTLQMEVDQLEEDVLFLHSCLDQAADDRSHATTPALSREPTLTELREERSLLEKELLSAGNLPTTPSVSKPSFLAKSSAPTSKLQNLTPVKTRLRPTAPASNSDYGTTKATPVRASHYLHPTSSSSPDPESSSPDSTVSKYTSSQSINPITAQTYDLNFTHTPPHPSQLTNTDRDSGHIPAEETVRRRESSGGNHRRNVSPARVKVVPMGSIVGARVDIAGGRPFIPTPPTAEKPQLPRPSSAERFRKMVMHSRETS